jgi:hypothetical protein
MNRLAHILAFPAVHVPDLLRRERAQFPPHFVLLAKMHAGGNAPDRINTGRAMRRQGGGAFPAFWFAASSRTSLVSS